MPTCGCTGWLTARTPSRLVDGGSRHAAAALISCPAWVQHASQVSERLASRRAARAVPLKGLMCCRVHVPRFVRAFRPQADCRALQDGYATGAAANHVLVPVSPKSKPKRKSCRGAGRGNASLVVGTYRRPASEEWYLNGRALPRHHGCSRWRNHDRRAPSCQRLVDRALVICTVPSEALHVGVDLAEQLPDHTSIVRHAVGHLLRDDDAGLVDAQVELAPATDPSSG